MRLPPAWVMPRDVRASSRLAIPPVPVGPAWPRARARLPLLVAPRLVAPPLVAPAADRGGGRALPRAGTRTRAALTAPVPLTRAFAPGATHALTDHCGWLLVDASGTVNAPDGDAGSIRHVGNAILTLLATPVSNGRGGVVHWGHAAPASHCVGPVPIAGNALRAALAAEPNLGGTRMEMGLAAVAQRIDADADRRLGLYVLSDGLGDPGAEVRDAVARLPHGCVHLLLVDGAGRCSAEREARWRQCGFGSVMRLALEDPGRAADQITQVVTASVGLTEADLLPLPVADAGASSRPGRRRWSPETGRLRRGAAGLSGLALIGVCLALLVLGLAALGRGHHHAGTAAVRSQPGSASAPAPGSAASGVRGRFAHPLAGVAMPATGPGNVAVKPIRLVLVVSKVGGATVRRELRALGGWLEGHANPRTRTTVVDLSDGPRRARDLTAAQLAVVPRPARLSRVRGRSNPMGQVWVGGTGQRLLVTVNTTAVALPASGSAPAELDVRTRDGARAPGTITVTAGQRTSAQVDLRHPRALAATIARAVISETHMTPAPGSGGSAG